MNQTSILKAACDLLEAQLEASESAAKRSQETASDTEHIARSKYETFSLETSYLARGQAMRVEELRESLGRLQAFRALPADALLPIGLGALVQVAFADAAA